MAAPGATHATVGRGPGAVTITELLNALPREALSGSSVPVPEGVGRTQATGVIYDSRKALPGTVFVAVRGQHADGTTFTPQAVARGAAVVIAEEPPRAGRAGALGAGR